VTSSPASKKLEIYAKAYTPPANKTFIYIARPARIVLNGVYVTLNLNYSRIGALGNGNFFLIEVPPGRHKLIYGSSLCGITQRCDPNTGPFDEAGEIEIHALPGRMYFFSVVPSPSLYEGNIADLEQLSEAEGRKLVNQSSMAQSVYQE